MQKINRYLPALPAVLLLFATCWLLWFIQDDAFITYRYVDNFLAGHGLVFNIGERVEGITNHGWAILLALLGSLGLWYIPISQILGGLLAAASIFIVYRTSQRLFGATPRWPAVLVSLLVGCNLSLAYWGIAGLETPAFACAVALALHAYLCRSGWLVAALLWAVWLRPEGAFVTGLFILIETIQKRRLPVYTLGCAAIAFLLSLPFVGFKLGYYGAILPNPFYAKTSMDIKQITNGLEYVWRFLADYGFAGLGLLMPLFYFRKMTRALQAVYFFFVLYTVYILLIGGDVLKVHRFFLPLFGASAILAVASLKFLLTNLKPKSQLLTAVLAGIVMVAATIYLPYEFVLRYNELERSFTAKMQYQAEQLLACDRSNFSVALPTIGIFGYTLIGHDIIDMLGLTDSTIAKYSDPPIPGMETTWKEQKHNSTYLLTRAPDYIVFSTGIKPSAPAERALMLYPAFVDNYRSRGWYYNPDSTRFMGVILSANKKIREPEPPFIPTFPVAYIENYKLGLDWYVQRKWEKAIEYIDRAIALSPNQQNQYVHYIKAFCHMSLNQHEKAIQLFSEILAVDSTIFEVHKDLYTYAILLDQPVPAERHARWLKELAPWYWPRVEREARSQYEQQIRRRRKE